MGVAFEHEFPRSNRAGDTAVDWTRVVYQVHLSRALDALEEEVLLPARDVLYQFSARGHDVAQVLLGNLLTHPHDAVNGYYRSRPLMLTLGLDLDDAVAGPMMRAGGMTDGRDIGVVFNHPGIDETTGASRPTGLPVNGGVGAQYTPAAGWAQAVLYHREVLGDADWQGAIGVAMGGDASVATNGFWSALTLATTQRLPMLFVIEDNGYGISVPSALQTPGANIAANLASFAGLYVLDGDGTEPADTAELLEKAVRHARLGVGPALVRLSVPRLCGHSAQDSQAYKPETVIAAERARDPLPKLRRLLVPQYLSEADWKALETRAADDVAAAHERARARPEPDTAGVVRHVFTERDEDGRPRLQRQGGVLPAGHRHGATRAEPSPESGRINMVAAIRRTLDVELETNPRVVVFGEDVGPKGGVHSVTRGLQDKHGKGRVFDTSLSEEGIIGRAVGMAVAGLMPVPEIQFRKYADPAEEQLNDTGTMRWRTANRFAAPMVVRIPGGFFKCGDPWHSQSNEVKWVHATGWRVAMPSNAEDAVGLLRTALRGNDPVIFFEHRAMLDDAWARRAYPGDDYAVPFGEARRVAQGDDLTVVTWGAMVPRCQDALQHAGVSGDVLDLRTLSPWDRDAVLASVRRTRRCLIVHEDNLTAGFGAEIAAVVADEAFFDLDAPVRRIAMPDVPSPHSPLLMNAVVPGVEAIADAAAALVRL